jgi:hypothetical protein
MEGPEITFVESQSDVQIVVSAAGARIEGFVRNADNQPVSRAQVVLVPRLPSRRDFSSFYKVARTDDSGSYTLRGVRPGDYDIYAWLSIPEAAYMNESFLRTYERNAQAVRVESSGSLKVQVNLATR